MTSSVTKEEKKSTKKRKSTTKIAKSIMETNLSDDDTSKRKKKKTKSPSKVQIRNWEAKRRQRFNDMLESLRLELPNCDPCPKIEIVQRAFDFVKSHKNSTSPGGGSLPYFYVDKLNKLERQHTIFSHIVKEAGITVKFNNKDEVSYTFPFLCSDNCKSKKKKKKVTVNISSLNQIRYKETDLNITTVFDIGRCDRASQTEVPQLFSSAINNNNSHLSCSKSVPLDVSSQNLPAEHLDYLLYNDNQKKSSEFDSQRKDFSKEQIVVKGEGKNGTVTVNIVSEIENPDDDSALTFDPANPSDVGLTSSDQIQNVLSFVKASQKVPLDISPGFDSSSNNAVLVQDLRSATNVPKVINGRNIIISGNNQNMILLKCKNGNNTLLKNSGGVFVPQLTEPHLTIVTPSLSHSPIMSTGVSLSPNKTIIHSNPSFPFIINTSYINAAPPRLKRIAPKPSADEEHQKDVVQDLSHQKLNSPIKLSAKIQYKRKLKDETLIPQVMRSEEKESHDSSSKTLPEEESILREELQETNMAVDSDEELENMIDLPEDMPCVTMKGSEVTEDKIVEMLRSMDEDEDEDQTCELSQPLSTSENVNKLYNECEEESRAFESKVSANDNICNSKKKESEIIAEHQESSTVQSGGEFSTGSSNYSIMSLCISSNTGKSASNNKPQSSLSTERSAYNKMELLTCSESPSNVLPSVIKDTAINSNASLAKHSTVKTLLNNSASIVKSPITHSKSSSLKSDLSVSSLLSQPLLQPETFSLKGLDIPPIPDMPTTSTLSLVPPPIFLHRPPFPTPPIPPIRLPSLTLPGLTSTRHVTSYSFPLCSTSTLTTSVAPSILSSTPKCDQSSVTTTNAGTETKNPTQNRFLTSEQSDGDKPTKVSDPQTASSEIPISSSSSNLTYSKHAKTTQSLKLPFSLPNVPPLPLLSTISSSDSAHINKSIFSLAPISSYAHPFPFCPLSLSDAPTTFSFTLTHTSSSTSSSQPQLNFDVSKLGSKCSSLTKEKDNTSLLTNISTTSNASNKKETTLSISSSCPITPYSNTTYSSDQSSIIPVTTSVYSLGTPSVSTVVASITETSTSLPFINTDKEYIPETLCDSSIIHAASDKNAELKHSSKEDAAYLHKNKLTTTTALSTNYEYKTASMALQKMKSLPVLNFDENQKSDSLEFKLPLLPLSSYLDNQISKDFSGEKPNSDNHVNSVKDHENNVNLNADQTNSNHLLPEQINKFQHNDKNVTISTTVTSTSSSTINNKSNSKISSGEILKKEIVKESDALPAMSESRIATTVTIEACDTLTSTLSNISRLFDRPEKESIAKTIVGKENGGIINTTVVNKITEKNTEPTNIADVAQNRSSASLVTDVETVPNISKLQNILSTANGAVESASCTSFSRANTPREPTNTLTPNVMDYNALMHVALNDKKTCQFSLAPQNQCPISLDIDKMPSAQVSSVHISQSQPTAISNTFKKSDSWNQDSSNSGSVISKTETTLLNEGIVEKSNDKSACKEVKSSGKILQNVERERGQIPTSGRSDAKEKTGVTESRNSISCQDGNQEVRKSFSDAQFSGSQSSYCQVNENSFELSHGLENKSLRSEDTTNLNENKLQEVAAEFPFKADMQENKSNTYNHSVPQGYPVTQPANINSKESELGQFTKESFNMPPDLPLLSQHQRLATNYHSIHSSLQQMNSSQSNTKQCQAQNFSLQQSSPSSQMQQQHQQLNLQHRQHSQQQYSLPNSSQIIKPNSNNHQISTQIVNLKETVPLSAPPRIQQNQLVQQQHHIQHQLPKQQLQPPQQQLLQQHPLTHHQTQSLSNSQLNQSQQQQQQHIAQLNPHLQSMSTFVPPVDETSERGPVKGQQQQSSTQSHLSPMGQAVPYSQSFDCNPYSRKVSHSPRSEARHQCQGYPKHVPQFQTDLTSEGEHPLIPSTFLDTSEDIALRGIEDSPSDHVRYFSVSHLVSPFNEGRKTNLISKDQNIVLNEEKSKEASKGKSNGRKGENKTRTTGGNNVKGNPQSGDARRRSPARSSGQQQPQQQSNVNSNSMWAAKNTPPKQGHNYSAEALIGPQNYGRPIHRQPVNQNYHFMPPNQMYQSSYSSHQMKNFVQNSSFGYGTHERAGVCNSDYNFQLHSQHSAGSLPYSHNMPYMTPSYPYQNLPSSSSSVLSGDLMGPPHHPGPYARLHDINPDPGNFSSNAFSLPLDTQDVCSSSNVSSGVGARASDQSFIISSSASAVPSRVGLLKSSSNGVTSTNTLNTSGKRPRYGESNMVVGTPTNFLDGSALSHISLHSFTPPCEESTFMPSNFLSGTSRHQSNFLFGSENFMPLNSSQHLVPVSNVCGNVSGMSGSSNNAMGINGPSNHMTMGPIAGARSAPPVLPPHGNSGHVPFNPLRMVDRQQMNMAPPPPPAMPHLSSSLANFNLTSIIPEIDGKNEDSNVNLNHTSTPQPSVSVPQSNLLQLSGGQEIPTMASLHYSANNSYKSARTLETHSDTTNRVHPPPINNSISNIVPPPHQVSLGLALPTSSAPSSFAGINFTAPET